MTARARVLAALLGLAASCQPATAYAQQLRQTVRSNATLGDSTLTWASDTLSSKTIFVTRAASIAQLRKALAKFGFDSLLTTNLNLTGGSVRGTPTWVSIQTFAAGQLVDSATGAARAPAGALTGTTLAAGVTGSSLTSFGVGARTDSATGAARAQILTTARTLWGVSFNGSASLTAKPAFGLAWTSTGRDSLLAGSALAFAANDTVYGQPVWNATQTFATGQLVDSATGAARAQTLTTSRTLWGLAFNGSANVTGKPAFGSAWSSTGRDSLLTGSALAFAVNDTVYGTPVWNAAQTFATGQKVDSATGAQRSQTLTTARTINGTSFDGSANVTVTAAAGTLTGTTLASGVTASSLTSFGTAARTDSTTGAQRAQTLTTARALWGQNFDGSAAITGSLTSVGSITGGASDMTIQSGTGASRKLVLQTTTSGSTATTALRMNEVQQALVTNGSAAQPAVGFAGDSITGVYRFGVDTLAIATAGVHSLRISGGASPTIAGGAGNMTILAGTGASRTMTLQVTNAGSAVATGLSITPSTGTSCFCSTQELDIQSVSDFRLIRNGNNNAAIDAGSGKGTLTMSNAFVGWGPAGTAAIPGLVPTADTIMGFYRLGTAGVNDTLGVAINGVSQMKIGSAGVLRLPNLPTEGSTKNAVCWDGTTFNVTQNAAATCTVSSSRFKFGIAPLTQSLANHVVFGLHPVTFQYKADSVRAKGVIAENADSVDARLATRDREGRVQSINYEQITASLLLVVRDQRDRIDSLAARLDRAEARIDSLSAEAHRFDCHGADCVLVPVQKYTLPFPCMMTKQDTTRTGFIVTSCQTDSLYRRRDP